MCYKPLLLSSEGLSGSSEEFRAGVWNLTNKVHVQVKITDRGKPEDRWFDSHSCPSVRLVGKTLNPSLALVIIGWCKCSAVKCVNG